jgi:hypothetical protein
MVSYESWLVQEQFSSNRESGKVLLVREWKPDLSIEFIMTMLLAEGGTVEWTVFLHLVT